MPKLITWMNNQRVGELTKLANGAHTFKYAPEWLGNRYARPLSLSLPLQVGNITSDAVFNFFDNLLEEVLSAYKSDIPLGMINEENDFRISVAGAQEKTALLHFGISGSWRYGNTYQRFETGHGA